MNYKKIGFFTAVSIVIANMIGTGVFTSLGFQVAGIQTNFAIIMLWLVGGLMALCGALVYGEIGAAFPENGGEYNFLSKIYHPIVGFLSGWISVTLGFGAPVAATCMALAAYLSKIFPGINATFIAITVLIFITSLHATTLKLGAGFQRYSTLFKILFILFFVIIGFSYTPQHATSFLPTSNSIKDIFSNEAFAIGLYWVSYAYSGWNASAYMTGEIENPKKNLPRSLFLGTLVVTTLYLLLNMMFLYVAPTSAIQGQKEVGDICANYIFGESYGSIMSIAISLLLISSISAMVLAGPRVSAKIGEDFKMLQFLAIKNKNNVPYVAVLFQSLISVVLILTNQFELIIKLIGFSLTIFTTLTVFGIFILRYKMPDINRPYKTWAYPITPVVFLLINSWILFYGFTSNIMESLYGLSIIAIGAIVYILGNKKQKNQLHKI